MIIYISTPIARCASYSKMVFKTAIYLTQLVVDDCCMAEMKKPCHVGNIFTHLGV
jgi:hypothetical protein